MTARSAPPITRTRGRAAASIASQLTVDAVECVFPTRTALAGVSFDLAPGEVLGVLGPSGCGKTTLLRIVAGVETPTAGRIVLDGREIAGPTRFVPPERRNVGLVFQDFALFPHLSVVENVAFGLRLSTRAEARQVATATLERVGLAAQANEYPHTLSGGEQQRVAIARAIAPRPGVLLMDEPFSGLDVELRAAMQEETLALLRETRATSIIVTHHPEEAMRFADRIAIMRAGSIVQIGRGKDLYHRPADIFVNRQFSAANEIPAVVELGGVDTVFGRFNASGFAEGQRVIVAIRQHGVSVSATAPGRQARLIDLAFLGDETIATYTVEGLDAPIRARVRDRSEAGSGRDVRITVDRDEVLIFADPGLRELQ